MWSSTSPTGSRRARLRLEEFEPRQLLSSGLQPTPAEQVFLERLNDARADPTDYGKSIGVDLSTVAPSQPLTFDTRLIDAAHMHSQDMSDHNYFAHTSLDGQSPGDRMTADGFSWTSWGESIAAGYTTPEAALAGLITDNGVPSLDHRKQLLAIDEVFKSEGQVGIGVVQNGSGYYQDYYTVDSASDADTRPFLTGVVYQDTDGNGRYDAGEGLGGVTITVDGVGSVTTWDSGGYSIRLSPGAYKVTASGGGLAAPLTKTVVIGDSNYRLDFNPANFQSDAVPVQVVNDAAGRPELFAIGLDDQVWAQKFDAAGHPVGGYFLATEGQVKAFAVGHDGSGNPELFALHTDGRVYAQKFDANDDPLGGATLTADRQVKAIAVGQDASHRPELFAIGLDDQVWAQKFDAAGDPAADFWLTHPGKATSLAVTEAANGNPELFIIGSDWQVYAQPFTADGDSAGDYFLVSEGQVKAVQIGHDAYNNPELFAIGLNDGLFTARVDPRGQTAGTYSSTTLGGIKGLAVGQDAANHPEVFAIGLDDQLHAQQFDAAGKAMGQSTFASAPKVKAVTVGHDAANNPELFAIGMDDQVWAQLFDGRGQMATDFWLTQPGQVK